MMSEEKLKAVDSELSKVQYYDSYLKREEASDDGEDKEVEDDNTVFIQRERVDFMFYNGQDEGRLTAREVSKYKRIVDQVIKNIEHPPLREFHTEILGDVKAKDKIEVAMKIKAFCMSVSEHSLEQIAEQQIIEEVKEVKE